MNADWLWDRDMEERDIKEILSNEKHPRFAELASLLLSRKNTPNEVFGQYLDQETFVCHWPKIKRTMRKNKWNDQRIIFWQAVYEKLRDDFRREGIPIRKSQEKVVVDEFCQEIGGKIRNLREQMGLTQKEVAKRLNISQQIISRIENGRENMSLLTLKRVFGVLGQAVAIDSGPAHE